MTKSRGGTVERTVIEPGSQDALPRSSRREFRLTPKWVFLSLAIIGILTTLPIATSSSDMSRMANIQALVDLHTLSIDGTTFKTIDKVFIDGHFYSDKLAMPALVGAIAYLPISMLGIELDAGINPAYYLITLLTVKAFWLAGLMAFFGALRFTSLTETKRLALTLALGLGSLYFTWSSTFNNHAMAASCVAIGFYFMLRARNGIRVRSGLFLGGLFFGLAGSSDFPIMAIYGAFFLYVVADPLLRRQVAAYLLPLLITVLPVLLVNYQISGSFVPVQLEPSNFLYPGSPWNERQDNLTGGEINHGIFLAKYAFHMLIGTRGFLIYNPFTLIAIPLLLLELRPGRRFAREARTVALASFAIVSYYILFSNNFGGWSYSIRWFVPLLPLWFFFLAPFIEGHVSPRRKLILGSVFAVSVIIAAIGLVNPWTDPDGNPPIVANLLFIQEIPTLIQERLG